MLTGWSGVIGYYRKFLPVTDHTPVVTLQEGNTPLVHAERIAAKICPGCQLYVKVEGSNPTGSFKDRGMTLAVSKSLEYGAKAIMCASTGNTSASAAAYGAKAGLPVYVLVPAGNIALGKLAQAIMHGAIVVQIEGNFDQALTIVKELCRDHGYELVNSINPFRLEGQKTAAMEVCDQLGFAPSYHVLPVGNAGNITAYWKGYREYFSAGQISVLPKMLGIQAEGAAPLVKGCVIDQPHTIASAIRIGNPASWHQALEAVKASDGLIDMVTDEEILEAYRLVAQEEGIFCEPASAASLAGVRKLYAAGAIETGGTVVCTLTGHGLKDPDTAIGACTPPLRVKAMRDEVVAALKP